MKWRFEWPVVRARALVFFRGAGGRCGAVLISRHWARDGSPCIAKASCDLDDLVFDGSRFVRERVAHLFPV